MSLLKQSILSLIRRPLRSVSICFILTISMTLILLSFSIISSTNQLKESILKGLPPRLLIDRSYDEYYAELSRRRSNDESIMPLQINLKELTGFAEENQSLYKFYGLQLTTGVYSNEIKRYSESESHSGINGFVVKGLASPQEEVEELYKGALIFGDYFKPSANFSSINIPVIVSKEFARFNNLSIGSEFLIELNISYTPSSQLNSIIEIVKEQYTLVVSGIYENTQQEVTEKNKVSIMSQLNELLIPQNILISILENSNSLINEYFGGVVPREVEDLQMYECDPYFVLNSMNELKPFKESFNSFNKDPYLLLYSQVDNYTKVSQPLEVLNQIVGLFTIAVVIGSALLIISSLINDIKHREQEIGIYKALGMTKKELGIRFYLELLIPFFISVFCAILIISLLSSTMTTVIRSNLGSGEFAMSKENLIISGLNYIEIMTKYTISISFESVIRTIVVSLFVTVLGFGVVFIKMIKYNPKDILMSS